MPLPGPGVYVGAYFGAYLCRNGASVYQVCQESARLVCWTEFMGVRYTTPGKLRKRANPYKAFHPKSWQNYEEEEG